MECDSFQAKCSRSSASSCDSPVHRHAAAATACSHDVTPLPAGVTKLAEILKKRYLCAKVQVGRGMSTTPNRRPLDEIYVNTVVIPRASLASLNKNIFFGSQSDTQAMSHVFSPITDQVEHVQLTDLFAVDDVVDESIRVLAVACAGAGKTTTFLLKGPMEWARGLIWRESALVCALALRDPSVRQAKNAIELLRLEQLGIVDPQEQIAIAAYVHDSPRQVCIVLDGLDETALDRCSSFVRGVISGELLKGIRLLLTSRHSAEVMKLSLTDPFDRRVEVLGFTKDNVCSYVKKVLPSEGAYELLDRVDEDPQLAAIMQTPFFAQSTCDIYRSSSQIPGSLPALFSALIVAVIRQNTGHVFPDWKSLPRILKEEVLELGHFAFVTLIEKKVVFSDRDLDEQRVSPPCSLLGLLVACEATSHPSASQWQFSHLAIQECLASRYIASTDPTVSDIVWLVRQLGALSGHLSTFWCLLATELSPDAKEALVRAVLTQPVSDSDDHNSYRGDVDHFLRSSEEDLLSLTEVLCSYLDEPAACDLARNLLDGLLGDGVSVADAMAQVTSHRMGSSGIDYVTALLQLWRRKVPRASVRLLASALESVSQPAADSVLEYVQSKTDSASDATSSTQVYARKLCMPSLWPHAQPVSPSSAPAQTGTLEPKSVMTASPAQLLSTTRPNAAGFDSLVSEVMTPIRRRLLLLACSIYAQSIASNVRGIAVDGQPLSPSLQRALLHYDFDFSDVLLTQSDCQTRSLILKYHHSSIRVVNLRKCAIGDNGYDQLALGISQCRRLTGIHLGSNSLTDYHALHIASIIRSNSGTLKEICVAPCQISGSGLAQLVAAILMCGHAETVFMGSEKCQSVRTNVLLALLVPAYCKNLHGLYLIDHLIGDEGLVLLRPMLVSKPLLLLGLCRVGLTIASAVTVGSFLPRHRRSVQFIDLSCNPVTDEFLKVISPSLVQCSSLAALQLDECNLTYRSLGLLAHILDNCSSLSILNVSKNNFRGEGHQSGDFPRAVSRHRGLRWLTMPERRLVDEYLLQRLDSIHIRVSRSHRSGVRYVMITYG